MVDWSAIGARIRKARRNKELSQAALASASGVGRSHITNVENGKDGLSLEKLFAIAEETEVSVSWLIGDQPESSGPPDVGRAEWNLAFWQLAEEQRQAVLALIRPRSTSIAASPVSPAPPKNRKRKREANGSHVQGMPVR